MPLFGVCALLPAPNSPKGRFDGVISSLLGCSSSSCPNFLPNAGGHHQVGDVCSHEHPLHLRIKWGAQELVASSACPGGGRGHPARLSPGKHKGASSSSSPGPWESAQHPAAPIPAALPSGMLGDSRTELTRAAAASCPSNLEAGLKVAKGKGFSSDSHQAL